MVYKISFIYETGKRSHMIVSFASMKGGTGKSTCCANVAYYLATKKNKKILIIDLDSQGGLSHILSSKVEQYKPTLCDATKRGLTIDDTIKQYSKNLHLTTADENSYHIFDNGKLEKFIDQVEDKYDLVFLDLCPSRFVNSEKPLLRSNAIVLPIDTSCGLSVLGAERFARVLIDLQREFNIIIVPNKIDRTRLSKECLEFIKKEYDTDVISGVKRSADIARSCTIGKTIFEHRSKSQGAKDFAKVAREILKRIQEVK